MNTYGPCRIDECGRPAFVKKHMLCRGHYYRLQTYGDPLGGTWRLSLPAHQALDGHWMKECIDCREVLSVDRYSKNPGTRDGYVTTCKFCTYLREIARKIGCTPERYRALYKAQDGRCAICLREDDVEAERRVLYVDHDHETGEPRGLLCGTCNSGLGMLQDNEEVLMSAIAYLQRHRLADEELVA